MLTTVPLKCSISLFSHLVHTAVIIKVSCIDKDSVGEEIMFWGVPLMDNSMSVDIFPAEFKSAKFSPRI
jgi:hypothetical protein